MDFVPNEQGEAVVCCGLGFPWALLGNEAKAGTVWYDNA